MIPISREWARRAQSRASRDDELDGRDIRRSWQRGDLRFLLHADQLRVYDHYRVWEQIDPSHASAVDRRAGANHETFRRIYVFDCGKRWGKTTLRIITRFEDCIRNPGRFYRYASAYKKNIDEIVDDVAQRVLETCPRAMRPEYRVASKTHAAGFYFPSDIGSALRLVGLDKDPDGLRGRASDGDDISEAAFIRHLRYSIKNVLYHQYQGRPWARMCLESSAPIEVDSEYDKVFVADAIDRGAYSCATIDDNPMLDEDEREEFIEAAGGRDHPDCQREYFNARVRDPERVVVPEFDESRHVREHAVPAYGHCYVAADPGSRDLFALVFGCWDFEAAKLIVQASWARRNPSTKEVAAITALYEWRLWGRWPDRKMATIPLDGEDGPEGWRELLGAEASPDEAERLYEMARAAPADRPGDRWMGLPPADHLTYWSGRDCRQNPFMRVTDVDLRFVRDLSAEYGLLFSPTAKDDAEAQRNALRNAIGADKLVFLPDSGPVVQHVKAAAWNPNRTDLDRHPTYGHFDCLAALVYMWRNCQRHHNPFPPSHVGAPDPDAMWVPPDRARREQHVVRQLNDALGQPKVRMKRRRWR